MDQSAATINTTNAEDIVSYVLSLPEILALIFEYLDALSLFAAFCVNKQWRRLKLYSSIWESLLYREYGEEFASNITVDKRLLPRLATRVLPHDYKLVHNDYFENKEDEILWTFSNDAQSDIFQQMSNIPCQATVEASVEHLLYAKPMWRARGFSNNRTKHNDRIFILPQYQVHKLPQSDPVFLHIFFHCIRDSAEVLAEIMKHYNSKRKRVIAILCQWIANYPSKLFTDMKKFIGTLIKEDQLRIEHAIKLQEENKEFDWDKNDEKYRTFFRETRLENIPSTLPKEFFAQKFQLTDVPPNEMAKQIALLDMKLFRLVKYDDLFNQNISKEKIGLIKTHNNVVRSLGANLICQPSKIKREEYCSYLIKLMTELISINCYNAAFAIYTSLNQSAVVRLKSVTAAFSLNAIEYDPIKQLLSYEKNYSAMRQAMKICKPPCIPHLKIYMTDVTFCLETSRDYSMDLLIGWRRRLFAHVAISDCLTYQNFPYLYEPVQAIQEIWTDLQRTSYGEDELYSLSAGLMKTMADDEKDYSMLLI